MLQHFKFMNIIHHLKKKLVVMHTVQTWEKMFQATNDFQQINQLLLYYQLQFFLFSHFILVNHRS